MMRLIFTALGLLATVWGAYFLVADTQLISRQALPQLPAWAACSLLVVGIVTVIYAVGLPERRPSLTFAPVRHVRNSIS